MAIELRRRLKLFLKKNKLVLKLLSNLIYWYLRLVYSTSQFRVQYLEPYSNTAFLQEHRAIFALWHNKLAMGPHLFRNHPDICPLVSSHSDGKIISRVINKFGFKVIEGSTNKNALTALREILRKLKLGGNIVITPDGPRGPVYNINSNITQIARKYDAKLIPISASCSHCFFLRSWDKLMVPLPFSVITVVIGSPLELKGNVKQDNANLASGLTSI